MARENPEPTVTGRRLKEAREALRDKKGKPLSLRALAEQSGVGAGVISRIESGATQHAEGETLKKLAPHLGVSVDWLLATDAPDATPPTPPAKSDVRPKGETIERDDVEIDGWFFETLQELGGKRRYTKEQVQAAKRFLMSGNPLVEEEGPRKIVLGALEAARELDLLGSDPTPEAILALLISKNAPPSGPQSGARGAETAREFTVNFLAKERKNALKGGFKPKKREGQ